MKLTPKENGLKKFIENANQTPKRSNESEKWETNNIKFMRLIVNGVKTHLFPIILELEATHEMLKALEDMLEINNTTRIITLRDNIKMNKRETISSYFKRIN